MVVLLIIRVRILEFTSQPIIMSIATMCKVFPFIRPLSFGLLTHFNTFQLFYIGEVHIETSQRWQSFFQNLIAFADIMCACQLMETAAYLSGLGACMVGNILGHGERLAELLHLPDRAYPIMMLALGYPARSSANRPKKLTPEDMVFQETYPAFSREEIIAAYYGFSPGQAPAPVKAEPRRKVVSLFDM